MFVATMTYSSCWCPPATSLRRQAPRAASITRTTAHFRPQVIGLILDSSSLDLAIPLKVFPPWLNLRLRRGDTRNDNLNLLDPETVYPLFNSAPPMPGQKLLAPGSCYDPPRFSGSRTRHIQRHSFRRNVPCAATLGSFRPCNS